MRKARMRAPHLSERQRSYRRTTNRLGAVLLLTIALHLGLSMLSAPLRLALSSRLDATSAAMFDEIYGAIARILAFLLPALFYRLITPYHERVVLPLTLTASRRVWLIIPAALAIIYCAAMTNAFLVRTLGLSISSSSSLPGADMPPYMAVLAFIATAVAPAFCEEFLFRGVVMSQLMPFGKTTAVLGSALLFGLIHQNYGQFFYATVAGVVLALVVMESGSIWVGVLIHLFNNMLSVIGEVFYNRLPYQSEMVLYRVMEVAIIGGGLICLIILLCRRPPASEGALRAGQEMETGAVRGFFSPMMVAFVALCVTEMLYFATLPWLVTWGWRML